MSEFVLYEVTSFNDVEIKKEHTVKELLYLDNSLGDVMVGYFDNFDNSLKNNSNEIKHYIILWGEDLIRLIKLLEDSLKSDSNNNHWYLFLKFVRFFPVINFNDDYYSLLCELHKSLKKVIPNDTVDNRERLFLYTIRR